MILVSEEMDAMSSSCPISEDPTRNLVKVIENHMMSYWSWIYSSPISRVEDEPEFLRLSCDVPHPMCNYVFRSRFPAPEVDSRIEEMIDFFRSRGLPMSWMAGPCCQPSDLGERLTSHGLALESEVVGMTIDLRNLKEDLPTAHDLTIKRVANEVDSQQYLRPFGIGFEFPDSVVTAWGRMNASHGFGAQLPRYDYVAMMDNEPISCASMFKTPDAAGIYCVATVPGVRRRGAATALIVNALREARDEGYKLGLLQAKAMGAGVYRKIGFVDQPCKIGWYVWQLPGATH